MQYTEVCQSIFHHHMFRGKYPKFKFSAKKRKKLVPAKHFLTLRTKDNKIKNGFITTPRSWHSSKMPNLSGLASLMLMGCKIRNFLATKRWHPISRQITFAPLLSMTLFFRLRHLTPTSGSWCSRPAGPWTATSRKRSSACSLTARPKSQIEGRCYEYFFRLFFAEIKLAIFSKINATILFRPKYLAVI
jgi:hypothetical protein